MGHHGSQLLSLTLLGPFVAALVILLLPERAGRAVRLVSLTGALIPCATSLLLLGGYDVARGGFQFVEQHLLAPRLGITWHLGVDGIGVPLVVLTAIIHITAVFTSWTTAERAKEFYLFLALLVTGVYGVFVSLDLFVFFLFYELAVLPMYVLIGIWGSSMDVPGRGPFGALFRKVGVGLKEYGAMKLTLYLLAGSALILVGILMLWAESGRQQGIATFDYLELQKLTVPYGLGRTLFLLFYVGFGVLAGIWPLHTWSPDGHAAAPAAGSMMHAGVLMKLGAYGVLRIAFGLLPDAAHELAWLVGLVAVTNILYGALAAGWQKDIKYLIAYSSVSHMGIVMLGLATLNAAGVAGSVYQMVAHGIMTALFFTLVNLVYHKSHVRDMTAMGGYARHMPGIATFFVIAGLSSLGLPGLAGFVAEFLVFLGAWTSSHPWWAIPGVIGALITALYVLRAVRTIFLGRMRDAAHPPHDAHGVEWVSLAVLAGSLLLLGVWPRLLLPVLNRGVSEFLARIGG
ncbi:MAG TPA: NADH-quinone oxidoreductase subunit M [Candidatus Sulfotelmatobacter sp.]|jgi:NADH-quinone oxidoreductase subunit M|nr:NADH-quinone oxidoreductase subunit M [Candidatus Sulfotelmatobacter sp.]